MLLKFVFLSLGLFAETGERHYSELDLAKILYQAGLSSELVCRDYERLPVYLDEYLHHDNRLMRYHVRFQDQEQNLKQLEYASAYFDIIDYVYDPVLDAPPSYFHKVLDFFESTDRDDPIHSMISSRTKEDVYSQLNALYYDHYYFSLQTQNDRYHYVAQTLYERTAESFFSEYFFARSENFGNELKQYLEIRKVQKDIVKDYAKAGYPTFHFLAQKMAPLTRFISPLRGNINRLSTDEKNRRNPICAIEVKTMDGKRPQLSEEFALFQNNQRIRGLYPPGQFIVENSSQLELVCYHIDGRHQGVYSVREVLEFVASTILTADQVAGLFYYGLLPVAEDFFRMSMDQDHITKRIDLTPLCALALVFSWDSVERKKQD